MLSSVIASGIGGGLCGVCQLLPLVIAHGGIGQQGGRGNEPAHAQAGAQNFAETAAIGQPVAAAGHRVAQGQHAGGRGLVKVQLAVGVVFHNQGFGAHRNFQNTLAPRQAQRGTAGVAKGGDDIHKFGAVFGYEFFENLGVDAMTIDWRRNELCKDGRGNSASAFVFIALGRTFDNGSFLIEL